MGSQRVRHDRATELNWTDTSLYSHQNIQMFWLIWLSRVFRNQIVYSVQLCVFVFPFQDFFGYLWSFKPTKVRLVKAMVSPVVTYGCESLAVKKAEHWRIDAFELWWLLRVPRTARRSNQSILKETSPGYSLEGLMLRLKLQLWPPHGKNDSLEKPLMLGGIEAGGEGDNRGWDGWMASLTWWTWVWVNSGSWWWIPAELPG